MLNRMYHFIASKAAGINRAVTDRTKLDVSVLIGLCLVTQHSFIIKFVGIFLLLLFNLNTIREFSPKKIPLFYTLIPSLELLKLILINRDFSTPHLAQFALGLSYWLASLLVCWIMYVRVQKASEQHVFNTLKLVSILNLLFSVFQLLKICFIEKTINPYNTGHDHPYGISTGDLINGLFHGVHLTNAFVSVILFLYFLQRNKPIYLLITLIPFLLTGSNYGTIILIAGMGIYFVIGSSWTQKGWILCSAVIIFLFYWLVTPLNYTYMLEKVGHIKKTVPNASQDIEREQRIAKIQAATSTLTVSSATYTGNAKKMLSYDTTFDFNKQSGKVRSYYQTAAYLRSSMIRLFFGAGMGNFSSKLAYNSSGVMEGSSLNKYFPQYQTPAFEANHKAIYAYLKTLHVMNHSEANRPFSVYNQLLGEYGVVGLLLFAVFYIWYFLKRVRLKSYALPVIFCLLCFLNIDYFIESISLLVFAELLLFMDIRAKQEGTA